MIEKLHRVFNKVSRINGCALFFLTIFISGTSTILGLMLYFAIFPYSEESQTSKSLPKPRDWYCPIETTPVYRGGQASTDMSTWEPWFELQGCIVEAPEDFTAPPPQDAQNIEWLAVGKRDWDTLGFVDRSKVQLSPGGMPARSRTSQPWYSDDWKGCYKPLKQHESLTENQSSFVAGCTFQYGSSKQALADRIASNNPGMSKNEAILTRFISQCIYQAPQVAGYKPTSVDLETGQYQFIEEQQLHRLSVNVFDISGKKVQQVLCLANDNEVETGFKAYPSPIWD